jgi:hypothetical protein
VDPRHPLFAQTFVLLSIEEREDLGLICVIARDWGQNSFLPLEVTDKAGTSIQCFPLPLSLQSIQELLEKYQALLEAREDEQQKRAGTKLSKRAKKPPSYPRSSEGNLVAARGKRAKASHAKSEPGFSEPQSKARSRRGEQA